MVLPLFIYGNHFWLGSRDECNLINKPKTVTFTTQQYKNSNKHLLHRPIGLEMSYRVTWANITHSPLEADNRYFRNVCSGLFVILIVFDHKTLISQKEILHIGLCLPTSCGIADTYQISTDYLNNNDSIIRSVYDISVNTIEVNDLKVDPNFLYKWSLISVG